MSNKKTEKGTGSNKAAGKQTGRFWTALIRHGVLAGTAFMLASLTFVITMDKVFLPLYQRSGSQLAMPDLRGVPYEDAERALLSKE